MSRHNDLKKGFFDAFFTKEFFNDDHPLQKNTFFNLNIIFVKTQRVYFFVCTIFAKNINKTILCMFQHLTEFVEISPKPNIGLIHVNLTPTRY